MILGISLILKECQKKFFCNKQCICDRTGMLKTKIVLVGTETPKIACWYPLQMRFEVPGMQNFTTYHEKQFDRNDMKRLALMKNFSNAGKLLF